MTLPSTAAHLLARWVNMVRLPRKSVTKHSTIATSIERMAAAERLSVAADAFAPVVPARGFGWVFVCEADFPNTEIGFAEQDAER
jgi:hypothetical protein